MTTDWKGGKIPANGFTVTVSPHEEKEHLWIAAIPMLDLIVQGTSPTEVLLDIYDTIKLITNECIDEMEIHCYCRHDLLDDGDLCRECCKCAMKIPETMFSSYTNIPLPRKVTK